MQQGAERWNERIHRRRVARLPAFERPNRSPTRTLVTHPEHPVARTASLDVISDSDQPGRYPGGPVKNARGPCSSHLPIACCRRRRLIRASDPVVDAVASATLRPGRAVSKTSTWAHPHGVSMRMRFYLLNGAVAVAAALSAASAEATCTLRPKADATDEQLARLATISRTDAERIAVAKVKRHAAVSVVSAELETEHGCLLWSVDLQLAGGSAIHEVQIDAGDGRILSVKRESAR